MGASAGTGVRGFAEGGSTSTPSSSTPTAPQRAIYRPEYTDYRAGLSATPQAQGPLASMLNMGDYGSQMPTFTRPQAVQQTPSYSIPYRTKPDSSFKGLLNSFNKMSFAGNSLTPEQQAANLNRSITSGNLTESQYHMMMNDPGRYLSYVQAVQAGNAPQTTGYQTPSPIQFMTTAQQKAYNDKMSRELDSLLRPITVFDVQDQGGS